MRVPGHLMAILDVGQKLEGYSLDYTVITMPLHHNALLRI